MFQDTAREEVLATLNDFSRRLVLPPDITVHAGLTSNDSFLLRGYARGLRGDSDEVAVIVDATDREGVVNIESAICGEDGHVYNEGPSLRVAIADDKQALEQFGQWLEQFREYLRANEPFFTALLGGYSQISPRRPGRRENMIYRIAELGRDSMTNDFYCDEALSGRTPVDIVRETGDVLAFRHTRPYWAVHIVVVPKVHVPSLTDLGGHDISIVHRLLEVVREVEAQYGGCRVVTNLGKYQDSKHLHFHVGSGEPRKV